MTPGTRDLVSGTSCVMLAAVMEYPNMVKAIPVDPGRD